MRQKDLEIGPGPNTQADSAAENFSTGQLQINGIIFLGGARIFYGAGSGTTPRVVWSFSYTDN